MDHPIIDGFIALFSSGWAIFYAILGTIVGLLAGATPGLTASAAISMIIPLSFYLEPLSALIFVYTIGKAASFGGSIPAILFNTPGTPQASATQIEGYPMTRQGKQGKALRMAVIASAAGDTFSECLLIFGAAFIAIYTARMGPPEVFAVYCTAFVIIGSVIGASVIRGLISTTFGILLAIIGLDPISSLPRFTFDVNYLETGIGLVPVLLGVFVCSEVFVQIADRGALGAERMMSEKSKVPEDNYVTWKEMLRCLPVMAKSTGMGTIIGMLPGVGASAACFVAFAEAKRSAAPDDKWGDGEIKGVAAAEAANNSVSGANLIPLLTLGIPGSVAAALLGGVFLIHGMHIGPRIFVEERDTIYGLFASGLLCIATYTVVGYWGSGFIGRVMMKLPMRVIYPYIFLTSIVAVYALRNTLFDVMMMFIFGFVGYFFKKFDYSLPAFIIAFILGPGAERALRQALLLHNDGAMIFLERPLAMFFIALAILVISIRIWQTSRAGRDPLSEQSKE
ncbi:MAG: tripartite tricarboxylate transporter permease [Proteobacteria bacterium]|nr:tripartite tricarboxylate transporter permease [Pseudomonadota bacterium]